VKPGASCWNNLETLFAFNWHFGRPVLLSRPCSTISDKCDAITRINQVGRNYAETKIRDFQVEEIMFGREAATLARTTGGQEKVHVLTQLTKDSRRKLLHTTQNAVWLHNAFLNEAESIAELRNCNLDIVLDFLSELTVEAYDCPEIPEIHQTWFFGEVHSNRETSEVQRTESTQVGEEKKTWLIPQRAKRSGYFN
jgi:hypothetical protein